jgi:hypothetical protein
MPKGETSKDPVQFPAKPPNPQSDDSVNSGLSELTQLARQAFEDKRRKQCLGLTGAILKIDPENKEALVLQSWLRASLQKEMDTARTLLLEARESKSLPLYDRAERSLRGVLGVDGENAEAKALLQEIISSQVGLTQTRIPEVHIDQSEVLPPTFLGRRQNRIVLGVVLCILAILGVVGGYWLQPGEDTQSQENAGAAEEAGVSESGVTPGSVELLTVPTKGVQVAVDDSPSRPAPQVMELKPGTHRFVFTAEGYLPETVTETVVSGTRRIVPVLMKSAGMNSGPARTTTADETKEPTPTRGARPPSRASNDDPRAVPSPPAAPVGTLSLTSAVPVDVYRAGRKLGTTPMKLQLPAGNQTMEYVYQGRQKTMSHSITNNQTTEATIVFEVKDVKLDINSQPYAEVFIEGSPKSLGETPLSNVTAPVGSWLLFKNPNFPQKRYRVKENDTAISIEFP